MRLLEYIHNDKQCAVNPVSPPPQQVEEDEDYVQVDRESSVDVFLWIQAVAHHPHHQLTVDHQELRQGGRFRTGLGVTAA